MIAAGVAAARRRAAPAAATPAAAVAAMLTVAIAMIALRPLAARTMRGPRWRNQRIQDHLSIPVPWGGSLGCICDQQGNALAFSPALAFQRGQSIANLRLASLTARGREVSLSNGLGSPQRLPYLATVARDGPST